MKSPLLGVLLILQLAILAVMAGQSLAPASDSEATSDLRALKSQLTGSIRQQRELILKLDQQRAELNQLRELLQALTAGGSGIPAGSPQILPGEDGPGTAEAEDSRATTVRNQGPFPLARKAMEDLRQALSDRRAAVDAETGLLGPLDARVRECRDALLREGLGALHWLGEEATRPPYEEGRDPELIQYLLDEVLPALASVDPESAFRLARDALLTVTNEPVIRRSGAMALPLIDDQRWVKEFIDVITRGGNTGKAISLRITLLDAFQERPRPEIVDVCRAFLADSSHPLALRNKAALVLSLQDSDAAEPALRTALFEDHQTDLRLQALHALSRRLQGSEGLRSLLQDVIQADPVRMPGVVQDQARKILEDLEAGS